MKPVIPFFSFILAAQVCAAQSQSFTTSGTFTVPSNVTSITVEVVGAGGNGGGNGGGGGGGGGYAMGTYTVTPNSTLTVTIGQGGGGSGSGTTSVGNLISATAGANGFSVSNPNIGGGGAGGTGIGGSVNRTGGTGGGGYWTYFGGGGAGAAGATANGNNGGNTIAWTGNCVTPGGAAGTNGGSPGGDGGKGAGFTDVNCNVTDPADNGLNYGGGGGGGNGNGGQPGTGADGYALITWGPTSTTLFNQPLNINVLTNPFRDRIVVMNASGNEQYELLNAVGQMVWSGRNIAQKDLSALPDGMYFLKVSAGNSTQTIKVVKQ